MKKILHIHRQYFYLSVSESVDIIFLDVESLYTTLKKISRT